METTRAFLGIIGYDIWGYFGMTENKMETTI